MAEEAALGYLLDTMKDVLRDRANLIAGAKTELGKLKNEFEVLKEFLKESYRISNKGDVFILEFQKQVRQVVHEVEDMLETCMIKAAAKGKMSTLMTKLFAKDVSLARQVRLLRNNKVTDMYDKAKKELDAMKNKASSSDSNAQEPQTKSFEKEIRRDKLVGFEDAEETITGYLMEPTEELDVISIFGMAGLGKTTIARKIYDSQDNSYTRVWVTVSGNFNKRKIFLDILSEFTGTDNSKMNDDKLGDAVRTCLNKGKYLIVFDDVCSFDDMEEIKCFLPTANSKCKVIITTRVADIGTRAGGREPYKLRFLREDESWKLLQLEVFSKLPCPSELAPIGKRIADKCDGLPLAILMFGGILRVLTMTGRPIGMIKSEWDKVYQKMPQYLKEGQVSEVIALSYERLPDELRDSFLYLGVFPEDHVIPSQELTRVWIAEGFIQKKDVHKSLEETAEWHVLQLVTRSLLIVSKINSMGKVKMCRVHDTVRAFCISKAAELNLYKEMNKEETTQDDDDDDDESSYHRRICLHSDPSTFLSAENRRPKVRSFLSFHKPPAALNRDYLDAFKLLRVLYSNSIKSRQLPDKTKELMLLRYITLDVDGLENLPKGLSHLWYLQTLVVHTTSGTLTVKANIWKMIRLRHLKTNAAILLDKNVIMKANDDNNGSGNLRTLSNLSTESCTYMVSKKVNNVRKLGIHGEIATLWETNFLRNLHQLEKLKLVNKSGNLHRLPEPHCFPPTLQRLTLSSTYLNWTEMSQLAKINTLEVLKLKDNAFAGTTWSVDAHQVFPQLQFLLIADAGLENWETSTDNFPRLECLSLNKCEKLNKIPQELLVKLMKLDIHRVRQSVYVPAKEHFEELQEQDAQRDRLQEQDAQRDRWAIGLQLICGDIIS